MQPPLLAIDCSFGGYSLALHLPGRSPLVRTAAEHPTTSIIAAIDELLGQARLDLRALAGIACGVGPGLFSGIRASVATAAGIAYVHGLEVGCVPTPLAVAAAASKARSILVAQPAHRGHCYLAGYRNDNGWSETLAPSLHALARLPALDPSARLCLHASLEAGRFAAFAGGRENFVGSELAPSVGKLALQETGGPVRVAKALDVRPHYVRDKVALTKQERGAGMKL